LFHSDDEAPYSKWEMAGSNSSTAYIPLFSSK